MRKCTEFDYDGACGAPSIKNTGRCTDCTRIHLRRVENRITEIEAELPRHRARRDALKKALGL